MKFFLLAIIVVLVGFANGAQLPDSATQGPNPQDIATPEPEYIDIDEPESVQPAPPAPAPVQTRSFAPLPPVHSSFTPFLPGNPSSSSLARSIAESYASPQRHFQPLTHHQPFVQRQDSFVQPHFIHQQPSQHIAGHTYSQQSGYQYRRPVFVRRAYRFRY